METEKSKNPLQKLKENMNAEKKNINTLKIKDILNTINKTLPVTVLYTQGAWIDVNTLADFYKAGNF